MILHNMVEELKLSNHFQYRKSGGICIYNSCCIYMYLSLTDILWTRNFESNFDLVRRGKKKCEQCRITSNSLEIHRRRKESDDNRRSIYHRGVFSEVLDV